MSISPHLQSSISWLDWNREQQEQMRGILSHFKEPGTADDLGVRQIQINVSNYLFPGTSVLLTRLRYVSIVVRVLMELERDAQRDALVRQDPIEALYQKELKIKNALRSLYSDSNERGIIGGTFSEEFLPRYLSVVRYYQTLLKDWCIAKGDLVDCLNQIKKRNPSTKGKGDEDDFDDADFWLMTSEERAYFTELDSTQMNFVVPQFERDFFLKRVFEHHSDRLLYWFMNPTVTQSQAFITGKSRHQLFTALSPYNTNLIQALSDDQDLQFDVIQATLLAALIRGASLVYNHLLCSYAQKTVSVNSDLIETRLGDVLLSIESWLITTKNFAEQHRCTPEDFQRFITTAADVKSEHDAADFLFKWFKMVFDSDSNEHSKADDVDVCSNAKSLVKRSASLIEKRERMKKKGLSRFDHHQRLQEWVRGVEGQHLLQGQVVDFRWSTIQILLADFYGSISGEVET